MQAMLYHLHIIILSYVEPSQTGVKATLSARKKRRGHTRVSVRSDSIYEDTLVPLEQL